MTATILFRFAVLYFGLFCLTSQIAAMFVPLPWLEWPDLETLPPVRPLVVWFARQVLGLEGEVPWKPTGSGDKTFDWVWMLCRLLLAGGGAVVWTALRGRMASPVFRSTQWGWFSLMLRVAVGTQMLAYGFAKLVPLQMPFPLLSRLVEPFGNFSPMGVLWSSIGASPAYESFLGLVEVVAGTLILIPACAAAGALLCAAVSLQIFVLNMTYDVPVKLLSFHLLVMAMLAVAPALHGLVRVLRVSSRHFEIPGVSLRPAMAGQCAFALCWLVIHGHGAYEDWLAYGPGAPKSPLYGIWKVEGGGGVRRVIFDEFPERAVLQREDDSFLYCTAAFDTAAGKVTLTAWREGKCKGELRYRRNGERLSLEGSMNGSAVALDLRLVDRNRFPLVRSRFHWVQETPYNR